jgi:hypothetical protein
MKRASNVRLVGALRRRVRVGRDLPSALEDFVGQLYSFATVPQRSISVSQSLSVAEAALGLISHVALHLGVWQIGGGPDCQHVIRSIVGQSVILWIVVFSPVIAPQSQRVCGFSLTGCRCAAMSFVFTVG